MANPGFKPALISKTIKLPFVNFVFQRVPKPLSKDSINIKNVTQILEFQS
jgi:hypothetical protein